MLPQFRQKTWKFRENNTLRHKITIFYQCDAGIDDVQIWNVLLLAAHNQACHHRT
jgi:hypothetical protein